MLELKKNCSPELIIYIVGSKADLHRNRAVTPDLARLSLHNWFPPPRPPTPPPPPPPPPSTLSYIRPRFTSFPSLRSPPASAPATTPETPAYLDLQHNRSSGLQRSKTSVQARPKAISAPLIRVNTVAPSTRSSHSHRFSQYGTPGGSWLDSGESSSNSIPEDEEVIGGGCEEQEWGLSKGMELFEVSAKDDLGMIASVHTVRGLIVFTCRHKSAF